VVFDDLPALGRQCLFESISSVVERKELAPQDEHTSFSGRIIACLEKAKKGPADGRILAQHSCCFSYELGKPPALECIARQHMRKNGNDRRSDTPVRRVTLEIAKRR